MSRGLSFRRRPSAKRRFLSLMMPVALIALGLVAASRLVPQTVSGQVIAQDTGRPVPGAHIVAGDAKAVSDQSGAFVLQDVRLGQRANVSSSGYLTKSFTIDSSNMVLTIEPRVVSGIVVERETGKGIIAATVSIGEVSARSDEAGNFRLTRVPSNGALSVSAAGYKRMELPVAEGVDRVEAALEVLTVKGLYVSFYTLSNPTRLNALINLVRETELNALVIDVKGDIGLAPEGVEAPQAEDAGAMYYLMDDFVGFVQGLKQEGIYLIARIVVFKDSVLAQSRPELAIKVAGTSIPFRDCEGQYWVDPLLRESWEYNLELALAAAKIGFDEVQFDYLRFPSDCIRGPLSYAEEATEEARVGAVSGFLALARERLRPMGVATSVDVFGWTTAREDDLGIGHRLEDVAASVDYVSPMVYPSTWEPTALGVPYPPAQPYEIVSLSLTRAAERLKKVPGAQMRAWLQDFDDYQARRIKYGPEQVRAQIRAAEEAGSRGWMLWDPYNIYTRDALGPTP